MNRNFYVYVDYTNDGRPFYVGKGLQQRVDKLERNDKHTWVSKNLGIERRVVFATENEQQALDKEINLIEELKTFSNENYHYDFEDIKCNHTLGGDGRSGYSLTEEQRKHLSFVMNSPKTNLQLSNASKKLWSCSVYRSKHSIAMKKVHNDEAYRLSISLKMKEIWSSHDYREKIIPIMRLAQQDPEEKNRKSLVMKNIWSIPEIKITRSLAMKEAWKDPELRIKCGEATKEAMSRPDIIVKMCIKQKEIQNRPEIKIRKSITSKTHWADPEKRVKRIAAIKAGHARRKERIRLEKLELEILNNEENKIEEKT